MSELHKRLRITSQSHLRIDGTAGAQYWLLFRILKSPAGPTAIRGSDVHAWGGTGSRRCGPLVISQSIMCRIAIMAIESKIDTFKAPAPSARRQAGRPIVLKEPSPRRRGEGCCKSER